MSDTKTCLNGYTRLWLYLLALALAPGFLSGCNSRSGRQGIEGTVTLDGRPLEKGQVSFRPQQGTASPSAGGEILDGRFSIVPERGLHSGKFHVEITASRPSNQKTLGLFTGGITAEIEEQYIPAKYNRQSQLEATVESNGPNRFEFAITSK
jgi:hypothetical protein